MKTVLFIDESRASQNDLDGLTKGWVFNGDNCAVGIPRQQSGSVVIIRGEMIRNELTGLFRAPKELKMYSSFLINSIEAYFANLLVAQLKVINFLSDHLQA